MPGCFAWISDYRLICCFVCLCFGVLVAAETQPQQSQPPATPPETLVQSVEQQRGGRHWIDKKTEAPKSAEESLACFRIEPGARIELLAAEPVVIDPVAMEFDQKGRLFVAEYGDYPVGPGEKDAPALSRIVLLKDTDNDGRMDDRTIFADHLAFCHSLMPLFEGILSCTETEIVFLKDTDGDDVADIREVWFSGFTPAHPQMQIGCPRWGYDNWIYLTYGPGKVKCERPGFETEAPVTLARQDFRFHPLTMQFESVTGLGQFGNTFDNDGHRFFSTNRNPIMTDVLSRSVMTRNPLVQITTGHTDVGPAGEDTRVYPLVDMKSNWLSHAGTHTSACGVTSYRGHLFDDSFQHSTFACEPVGHLVTRSIIKPQGASLTAQRARPKADFLASTDTWFRPASLCTGPDGALYLADMYRLWVEHPKFVPEDVAAKMDWRAGEDRGRIWRIVPEGGFQPDSPPETASAENLVHLLRHANGWRRLLGQRLIVEKQLMETVPMLQLLSRDQTASSHSRMHALWTLDGLGSMDADVLSAALADPAAIVRRDAARLVGLRFPRDQQLLASVESLCNDENFEVRLHAVLSLFDSESQSRATSLASSVASASSDRWLVAAVMSASPTCSGAVLRELVTQWNDGDSLTAEEAESRTEILRQLASAVAVRGDQDELGETLSLFASTDGGGSWWRTAIIIGISQGLPKTRGQQFPKSLAALIEKPPAGLEEAARSMDQMMQQAVAVVTDGRQTEADRLVAVRLLPYQSPAALTEATAALLRPDQPLSLQTAAMETIRGTGRSDLALMALNQWNTLRPQVRSQVLSQLLVRSETTTTLLQRMLEGKVAASVISIDQRLRLLQHKDDSIRQMATELFGGNVSANRQEVATQYSAALTLKSDAQAGAKVFEKSCSKCHRIDGVGHQVGPDISDTRSRARDALLYDILDPNRRVDPQYSDYVVVTSDGRTFNGLMVSETPDAVVLRQAEAIQQTVLRTDIEEIHSTNRSLMPEGIEKDVSVQQMADLLEFLKSR
ncbi:MAG: c-type cytochrome [Planctomycetaceae bacterium]|nr:c-type cytochrome [Planctomycetaceae bacterium]